MDDRLAQLLHRLLPDVDHVAIEALEPIPGGFSRETFRFDARVTRGGTEEVLPLILRKDPPAAAALLHTSRQTEHELLEAIRAHTDVPVSASYGCEMDPAVFGEPAMVIQRMHGSGHTSHLFHDGPDVDQADDVMAHLCELMAELHTRRHHEAQRRRQAQRPSRRRHRHLVVGRLHGLDVRLLHPLVSRPRLRPDRDDHPRRIALDAAYTNLGRCRSRVVHGDFNPANFLYADGKVTALIDWENARIGDPREDLGWMVAMDNMSNTTVMSHPKQKGGFLAYYNELTGFDITPEELGWFMIFGTMNIAVPVTSAVKRRVTKEHTQFLHLYLLQPSVPTLVAFTQLLGYPGATPDTEPATDGTDATLDAAGAHA